MIQRNRSLSTIAVALIAALGFWAMPAQAGSRGHSGVSYSVSFSGGYGRGPFYYQSYGHSRPYYGHSRSYRPYRGHCYYPRHSYRYRSYGHRGRGYRGHRGRW